MFRRLVTGTFALLFTVGVIGGAPLLLIRIAGSPIPQRVPSLEEIWRLLLSPDDGGLFLKLLTIVGWLAWATFTISVLVEIPARLRGRKARRIPGLGPQQRVAGVLVGSMLAIFVGTSVAHAASAGVAAAPAQAVVAVAPVMPHVVPHGGVYMNGQQPQQLVYVVNRGDYLGRIAERFTGDFHCFRDIAKLNPNLIRHPDHIEPGWRLVLPANSYDRGIMSHATGTLATPETAAPPPPVTPPPPPPPPPSSPAPPPTTQAPAPTTQAPAPTTQAPVLQTPPPVAETPQTTPASEETGDKKVPASLAAGAGLAAASVLAAHVIVHRRQLLQTQVVRRRRRRVQQVFVPTLENAAREAAQQMAKHRAVDRLDAALRSLAIGLRGRIPTDMPDIAAVWQSAGDIAVILTSPSSDPPAPFEERWQNTWSLPESAPLPESSWAPALLPGLLTFAAWPEGAELLVDTERTGLVTVTGDPQTCADLLRSLATEAATAHWTDGTSILLAGMDQLDMRNIAALNPSRVRLAESVPEALTRISKRAAANANILQETGTADTMAARIGNVTEGFWATHVLFVSDPWGEHSQQLRELDNQLAGLRRVGVAVIATHPTATRWSATVGSDSSLHMAWLAVAGAKARQLSSEEIASQLEVQILR